MLCVNMPGGGAVLGRGADRPRGCELRQMMSFLKKKQEIGIPAGV
jgi:hypothetical protein